MEHPTARNSHAIDVVVNAQSAPTTVETTDGMTRITVNIPDTADIGGIYNAVSRVIPRVERAHFRGLVLSNATDAIYDNLRHKLEELVRECVAQDVNSGKRPEHKIAEKSGAIRTPNSQRRDMCIAKGQHRDARIRDACDQLVRGQAMCDQMANVQLARGQAMCDQMANVQLTSGRKMRDRFAAQTLADRIYAEKLQAAETSNATQLANDAELAEKMQNDPTFEIPSAPVVVVATPAVHPHATWYHPVSGTTSISATTASTYSVIGDIIPNSRFSPARNEQYIADAINRNYNIARDVNVSAENLRWALNKIQQTMRNATNIPPINVGNRQRLYNHVKTVLGGPRADQWSVCQIVDILLKEQQ